jgi:hypothetical protein
MDKDNKTDIYEIAAELDEPSPDEPKPERPLPQGTSLDLPEGVADEPEVSWDPWGDRDHSPKP